MKLIQTLLIILSIAPIFSQVKNAEIFDAINKRGNEYITPLKNGKIESLRNANPPKDTWLFANLENYKRNLGSKDIVYGSIINPSTLKDSNIYSYNYFAYDTKKELYYFVAIVSYIVDGDNIKFDNSYLFTEKKSLKDWWMSIASFYKDRRDKIPKEFVFEICPPPPFKT
ncbi:hypothetical protein [Maribacter aestuarii]|uniref:hypothetical protein n=1 Tax=Maribacter aestuarii TaxID=1130723 RepID=UPI0025A60590|nr:hypothetical protein [Maribacter aestuarii]